MSTTLIVVASATPSALLGALVVLMPALRMRSRAAIELVAADAAVTKAEELLTEYDRTRNLPWYWPTDGSMAIEAAPEPEPAADPHVTGELLAIDGVDTETDAPHEDTDRAGMWRVLAGLARDLADRAWRWLARGVGYGIEWAAYLLKSDRQREAEFIDSYQLALEQARDEANVEVCEEFEAAVREAKPEPEPVRIVRVNRYRDPGMTSQFPYVKVAGAPRHAAPEPEMPAINAAIPAQRTGDEA